jgi:hypothetical protein
MKHFIFLSILFFFSKIHGQSISLLDAKNGFKEIHLGDSKSAHSMVYDRNNFYQYTGNCCQDVFGFPVEKILLTLNGNTISAISIIMPKGQGDKFSPNRAMYLDDYFEELFGKNTYFEGDDNTGDLTSQWVGRKVALTVWYKYWGASIGWQANILIETKAGGDGF